MKKLETGYTYKLGAHRLLGVRDDEDMLVSKGEAEVKF